MRRGILEKELEDHRDRRRIDDLLYAHSKKLRRMEVTEFFVENGEIIESVVFVQGERKNHMTAHMEDERGCEKKQRPELKRLQ